ncbi:adhesion regulating molecule [Flagelloscypha sp. PMI_526]|nr:adhesion regulating molecule [Flagelloscypha sp. PMI_526]
MSETLLAFKAGRAVRREGSNSVEPVATKGAISLTSGDDGLLHFIWRNRLTNEIEEDLILFPSDASFIKVSEATSGRVYVLKFSSSDQRHFFWMQDESSARDEEFANNVNGLLQDPSYNLVWSTSSQQAATSAEGASTSTQASLLTPEQLARLTRLIQGNGGHERQRPAMPDLSLTDLLTPSNLVPLFADHPDLIPALFPHLPPDLPVPPSPHVLQQIINSPQFRSAVSSFDLALRTGLLANLVRGLGLPEEAGLGIEPFLRAVQDQANRENGSESSEHMETE